MVLQLWFRLMIPQFLEEMAHRHIHKRTSVPLSVLSFLAHGLEAWVLVFGKDDIVLHSRTEIWACLSAVFPDTWVGYVRFNFGKQGTLSHSQTEIHACQHNIFWQMDLMCETLFCKIWHTVVFFKQKFFPISDQSFLADGVDALYLTLILLTCIIWWAPNNASKWQMDLTRLLKS